MTSNTLVQAAWLLLLQRYTGQQTVCFGATVAGRPAGLPGADEMLGLFINTLPIIHRPEPQVQVSQWLQALQAHNLEVRDHEHASLADIQRWSGQGGQALFDSILVFENYPVDERLQQPDATGPRFGKVQSRDVTNFAMDLAIKLGDTFEVEFLYLRNRFTVEAVTQLRADFEALLQGLLQPGERAIGAMAALHACDAQPEKAQAPTQLVAQRIARHAFEQADAVAVACAGTQLTYAQLELRANQLAARLLALGAGPETFVGVALERSVESVVALYAVLKAGAAFVPLDISYPSERLQWIMQDSGMSILLTQRALAQRLPQVEGALRLYIEDIDSQAPGLAVTPAVHAEQLAYLIYTSGSTGVPKGWRSATARSPSTVRQSSPVTVWTA